MSDLKVIISYILLTELLFSSSANICGPVSANVDIYVPKTFNKNSLYTFSNFVSPSSGHCAMSCSQQSGDIDAWNTCSGFRWMDNICELFAMAKETYLDFQPNFSINSTLQINKNRQESFNNYKLMSIGDTNHSLLGAYGPGSQFVPQERLLHFSSSILNLSVSPNEKGKVENEGVAYNWLNRQFVFCGGQQSTLGTNMSTNCWAIKMDDNNGLWQRFVLKVGRRNPTLVSLGSKIYVLGGQIINIAMEIIEALDLDTNTVGTLPGPDGKDLKIDGFINSRYSCAIALEDLNSFLVTGGYNGRYTNTVAMLHLDGNVVEVLPNMTTGRWYHECSRITRFGHDYIMVFGGEGSLGRLDSSIELYDLTQRPQTWTVWTGVTFPIGVGRMLGSVVLKFDDDYCNAMIISFTRKIILECVGNHQWTWFDISKTSVNGLKKAVKIDANFF